MKTLDKQYTQKKKESLKQKIYKFKFKIQSWSNCFKGKINIERYYQQLDTKQIKKYFLNISGKSLTYQN